jgi:hypothetical protein
MSRTPSLAAEFDSVLVKAIKKRIIANPVINGIRRVLNSEYILAALVFAILSKKLNPNGV